MGSGTRFTKHRHLWAAHTPGGSEAGSTLKADCLRKLRSVKCVWQLDRTLHGAVAGAKSPCVQRCPVSLSSPERKYMLGELLFSRKFEVVWKGGLEPGPQLAFLMET